MSKTLRISAYKILGVWGSSACLPLSRGLTPTMLRGPDDLWKPPAGRVGQPSATFFQQPQSTDSSPRVESCPQTKSQREWAGDSSPRYTRGHIRSVTGTWGCKIKAVFEGFIFWVPSVWMWCPQLVPIKKPGKWKTLITMKSDRRLDSPTST